MTARLPNNAMSNIFILIVIPIGTALTLHAKRHCCDTFRRGPRHASVDCFMMSVNNLLAFSLFVIWATTLTGSSTAHLERLVVVDVLFVIHLQQYVLSVLFKYSRQRYHEPGELALRYRKRRMRISMVVTILACSGCAAVSAVTEQYFKTSDDAFASTNSSKYWFIIGLLPLIHAIARTFVLDTQGCRRPSSSEDEIQVEIESTTNSFTITDDDDEELGVQTEEETEQVGAETDAV